MTRRKSHEDPRPEVLRPRLYSSTFLSEAEFDALYNGAAYRKLKAKYDAGGNAQTLYKKVALAAR
jgi:hypothetical protein